MNVDEHLAAFREHRAAIDWAIDRGIEKSQRIIGTHASRCMTELLSAYLHKINKIDPGFQVNHRWFKSARVGDRFPDFPKKKQILGMMADLEYKSEKLTYGSQKSEKEIKEVVALIHEMDILLRTLMDHEK